jgi:hypothetical protein
VVDRDVEEPLNLLSVQIHRKNPVNPGCHQQIGNQLGSDRNARLILAILAAISSN